MTNNDLLYLMKNLPLNENLKLRDGKSYYVPIMDYYQVHEQYIVLTYNGERAGIIEYRGSDDIHIVMSDYFKGKHIMSDFLRTGILREVFPDIECVSIVTDDYDVNAIQCRLYLAKLTGYVISNIDEVNEILQESFQLFHDECSDEDDSQYVNLKDSDLHQVLSHVYLFLDGDTYDIWDVNKDKIANWLDVSRYLNEATTDVNIRLEFWRYVRFYFFLMYYGFSKLANISSKWLHYSWYCEEHGMYDTYMMIYHMRRYRTLMTSFYDKLFEFCVDIDGVPEPFLTYNKNVKEKEMFAMFDDLFKDTLF